MSRRSGVTLVEVLVAIFVMGIGLIALLTLFPIGMLRMARAIHDERARQAALNAHSVATAYDLRDDKDVVTATGGTRAVNYDYVGVAVDNHDMFADPWPASIPTKPPNWKAADPYGESYSIFVDPIGYYNVPNGVARHWVAGSQGVLRRRPVEFVRRGPLPAGFPNNAAMRRFRISQAFTLWDDMVFNANLTAGSPGTPTTIAGTVLRDPRFSWGYTMRRPQTSDRSVVDCSIVVFDKRSLSITGNGSLSEYVYPNTTYFDPQKSTITIDYSGIGVVPPPVRSGDWILDATRTNNATGTAGSSHAFWYRIVATEELLIAGKTYARFEVQQPIRGFSGPPTVVDPTSGNAAYQGTAVILDGVADVFDRGPDR